MTQYDVVTNHLKFREIFLSQIKFSQINESYEKVINVILYFVWRGAFLSRAAFIKHTVNPDLGLLCLSIYKAFLPILQNIRLGYPSDAFILLRALMERIAILGFLIENNNLIPQFISGKENFQKKAMAWAKEHSPENWMSLYGIMSNLAHSKLAGIAGHILDNNPIGEAFRLDLRSSRELSIGSTDELLAIVFYSLTAVEPFSSSLLNEKILDLSIENIGIFMCISIEDYNGFKEFLEKLTKKYTES